MLWWSVLPIYGAGPSCCRLPAPGREGESKEARPRPQLVQRRRRLLLRVWWWQVQLSQAEHRPLAGLWQRSISHVTFRARGSRCSGMSDLLGLSAEQRLAPHGRPAGWHILARRGNQGCPWSFDAWMSSRGPTESPRDEGTSFPGAALLWLSISGPIQLLGSPGLAWCRLGFPTGS